jgi:hypothetical protein
MRIKNFLENTFKILRSIFLKNLTYIFQDFFIPTVFKILNENLNLSKFFRPFK